METSRARASSAAPRQSAAHGGEIDHPTLMVYGTADPTGDTDLWRRVMRGLPRGELEVMDGAGHEPWFEDASLVATRVSRFLADPPGADGALVD